MKALQKNQGRTDQLLGAMADLLTSVAIPNQQWVSCGPAGVAGWLVCRLCVFLEGLRRHRVILPSVSQLTSRLAKFDSLSSQKS